MKNRQVNFRINEIENQMLLDIQKQSGYRIGEVFRIGLRKAYMEDFPLKKEEDTIPKE